MRALVLLLSVVLLSFCVGSLNATTIHVPADSTTIQAGINGAVDGDTVLVADGTYTGDGNRDISFMGKAIVVMSENGPEVTIIDCQNAGRGFHFHSGENTSSVLQGLTITNGYQDLGGGIGCEGSSPTITGNIITGNAASIMGGGMYNSSSSPTVINCTFSGNSAAQGGGMFNYSSHPYVTNCTFSENSAGVCGGMRNHTNSSPMVANCTFSGNTSQIYGGGMGNHSSNPTVYNCTFSGNFCYDDGGGMYNSTSSPTVTNCTFTDNTTASEGGGMANGWSSPTVTNCTFSGNSANSSGGGMHNWQDSNPTVTNCVLWDDIPDEISNGGASFPIVTYSDVQGGFTGEGNIDEDPMFVLSYQQDYRLLWPSPCIDTGNPTQFDPDGTRSDMGAHYFNQDDFLTLYLTPDATEVAQGGQLGVTYTAINRWEQSEPLWLLSQVLLPGGSSLNVFGPDQYTLPANYTAQVHITHPVPNITPTGVYQYRSLMGMPPGTLYDDDSFQFKVTE